MLHFVALLEKLVHLVDLEGIRNLENGIFEGHEFNISRDKVSCFWKGFHALEEVCEVK